MYPSHARTVTEDIVEREGSGYVGGRGTVECGVRIYVAGDRWLRVWRWAARRIGVPDEDDGETACG